MSEPQAPKSGYAKPIPVTSHESRPYWEALRKHELVMPRCGACGHRWFPPTLLCPSCRSAAVAWEPVSGRGKVFPFVVFHRTYHKVLPTSGPIASPLSRSRKVHG